MWLEATAALMFPAVQGVAVRIREQLRMEARANLLADERDVLAATIQMACQRLGGLVEGKPPHAGNFLQRIDELRRIEATT